MNNTIARRALLAVIAMSCAACAAMPDSVARRNSCNTQGSIIEQSEIMNGNAAGAHEIGRQVARACLRAST